MIDSFGNIPSHPLLVHIPVVLIPLSLMATVLMMILPSVRRRYGTLAISVLFLATAGTVLAARSGRTLAQKYTDSGQTISDLLQDHIDSGNRLQFLVAVYLIASILWLYRSHRGPAIAEDGSVDQRARLLSAVVIVFVLVAGALTTASTLRIAQSGARSVWEQISPE